MFCVLQIFKLMKNFSFLLLLSFILSSYASEAQIFDWTQDFTDEDSVSTCDGILTLNNNNGSLSNQTKIVTICPELGSTELEFFSWSLNTTFVSFTIYDGDDTNAPVLFDFQDNTVVPLGAITASETNSSGCITLEVVAGFIPSIINIGFSLEARCAFECPEIDIAIFVDGSDNCDNPNDTLPTFSNQNPISVLFNTSISNPDFEDFVEFTLFINDEEVPSGAISEELAPGIYEVKVTAELEDLCEEEAVLVFEVRSSDLLISDVNDMFTLNELISDVFITGNCANVGNISSPNNASLNAQGFESIGYFEAGCTNFPFENGIVIGSGALGIINGTSNSSGTTLWPGNEDLTLLANGGIGNGITRNATIVEFEFSSYEEEVSFNYIFASNEYPTFVCNYADPFAFIISGPGIDDTNSYNFDGNLNTPQVDMNLGGLNIATIPDEDGNLVPITVSNIHENPNCPEGSLGFVSYPDFYSGASPYHNINGETVVLTATANVIPCETYTLKLMVADWQDTHFDSYVFLEGGSFDLGANLGDDVLFTDEEPIFEGQTLLLEPFDEDFALNEGCNLSVEWFKDGVLLEGENDLSLEVTESGLYEIFLSGDNDLAGCSTTDQILIEVVPVPNTEAIGNMFDLLACQPSESNIEFDLTINEEIALAEQENSNFNVSFHLNEEDALNNENPIINSQNYFVNTAELEVENRIIWIRIEEALSGLGLSSEIANFQIGIANPSIPDAIETIQQCNEFTGNENFLYEVDLTSVSSQILAENSSVSYEISYHFSEAEAISNENAISAIEALELNESSNEIFVRVTTISSPDCFEVSSFFVESYVNPEINTLEDLENCKSLSLDSPIFDLSQITPTSVGTPEPSFTNLNFYFTEAEALASENSIVSDLANFEIPGDLDEITLFVRLENNDDNGNCFIVESFNLNHRVFEYPSILEEIELCISADEASYEFSLQLEALTSVAGEYNFEFYSSEADAIEGDITNELTNANATDDHPINLNVASTITMRISFSDDPNCYQLENFSYVVFEEAVISELPNFELCADFDNATEFDFSSVDSQLNNLSTTTSFEISYFESEADAQANQNALIVNPSSFELSVGEFEKTIFVRVENPFNEDCTSFSSFNLTAFPTEIIMPEEVAEEIVLCPQSITESNNTFLNLEQTVGEFLGENQSLDSHSVSFYTSEADAVSGVNEIDTSSFVQLVNGVNTFFVKVENLGNASCFAVDSFTYIFNEFPEINQVISDFDECLQDGNAIVDLTSVEDGINSGNLPSLTFTYFLDDVEVTNPTEFEVSNNQNIDIEILNEATGCTYDANFSINTSSAEVIIPEDLENVVSFCPQNQTESDEASINLQELIVGFLGDNQNLTSHSVGLYTSENDALSGLNELTNLSNVQLADGFNTFFIKVESIDNPSCFEIDSITYVFNEFPDINLSLENVDVCLENGAESFDLTETELEINLGNLTTLDFTYFNLGEEILNPSNFEVNNSQFVEVEIFNSETGCTYTTSFNILVYNAIELGEGTTLIGCEPTGIDFFDLTDVEEDLLANVAEDNISVEYYLTEEDAANEANPIANIFGFENTSNPQTIFVVVKPINQEVECLSITSFELFVNPDDPSCESLGSNTFENGLSFYPNPASSSLNISNQTNIRIEDIKINNISGQTVARQKLNSAGFSTHQIDVSNLASGIYFIEANSKEGQKVIYKFIKR